MEIINLKEIYILQEKLDQAIIKKHNIIVEEISDLKILALMVELGEFANELKTFKYWKINKTTNPKKIAEEYVDGIHFFVGIALENNFSHILNFDVESKDINQQLLLIYKSISEYQHDKTQEKFHKAFSLYLGVIKILNFNYEQMFEDYKKKSKINFERLENGY